MKTFRICLTILATLTALPVFAQLSATLTLAPETTLPGIPVTARIVVKNDSATSVRIPDAVSLVGMFTNGESFTVLWQGSRASVPTDQFGATSIAPHGSTALVLRATGTPLQNGWFDDPRLNMPSRLQLRAVLGNATEQGATNVVSSAPVLLQIEQPTGDDAQVWAEMLAIGQGRWQPGFLASVEGHRLGERVVATLPHSSYAGWFATVGVSYDYEACAEALRRWLSQAAQDEYTTWRELRLAMFEDAAGRRQPNANESGKHFRAARALYERLMHTTDAEIADTAKKQLQRLAEVED